MTPTDKIEQLEIRLNKLQKDIFDVTCLPMIIPIAIKKMLISAVRESMKGD